MNKFIFLSIIFLVLIFSGLFSYKFFSIKLQEKKEKEIIQTQLFKEKEILDYKSKQKEEENLLLKEKKVENVNELDSCLHKSRSEYITLWEKRCKEISDSNKRSYDKDCAPLLKTEYTKDQMVSRLLCGNIKLLMRYDPECSLSENDANQIKKIYEDTKKYCYNRYPIK